MKSAVGRSRTGRAVALAALIGALALILALGVRGRSVTRVDLRTMVLERKTEWSVFSFTFFRKEDRRNTVLSQALAEIGTTTGLVGYENVCYSRWKPWAGEGSPGVVSHAVVGDRISRIARDIEVARIVRRHRRAALAAIAKAVDRARKLDCDYEELRRIIIEGIEDSQNRARPVRESGDRKKRRFQEPGLE